MWLLAFRDAAGRVWRQHHQCYHLPLHHGSQTGGLESFDGGVGAFATAPRDQIGLGYHQTQGTSVLPAGRLDQCNAQNVNADYAAILWYNRGATRRTVHQVRSRQIPDGQLLDGNSPHYLCRALHRHREYHSFLLRAKQLPIPVCCDRVLRRGDALRLVHGDSDQSRSLDRGGLQQESEQLDRGGVVLRRNPVHLPDRPVHTVRGEPARGQGAGPGRGTPRTRGSRGSRPQCQADAHGHVHGARHSDTQLPRRAGDISCHAR